MELHYKPPFLHCLVPADCIAQDGLAVGVNAMQTEGGLRQIDADGGEGMCLTCPNQTTFPLSRLSEIPGPLLVMMIDVISLPADDVTCSNCQANCCRLEVMLITDTGVPERYTDVDDWGGRVMARLDDGWCAALDRSTMLCRIYEKRPLICREFEMGGHECLAERN